MSETTSCDLLLKDVRLASDEGIPTASTTRLAYIDRYTGQECEMDIPLNEHPQMFEVPMGTTQFEGMETMLWNPRWSPQRMLNLSHNSSVSTLVHRLDPNDWYRYLAKIAYCYCVAQIGWTAMDMNKLRKFIRGETKENRFVGMDIAYQKWVRYRNVPDQQPGNTRGTARRETSRQPWLRDRGYRPLRDASVSKVQGDCW